MHIDSKMPLLCSVRETVSKRGIFNLRDELSLNGSELQSSLLLLKKKEKTQERRKSAFSCPCAAFAGPKLLRAVRGILCGSYAS